MAFYYGGDKYRDLWDSTLSYYSDKLIDMLPRSHPLLTKIAGNNNIKGSTLKGKRFVQPILARTIDNVQGIGYRDDLVSDYAELLEVIECEPKTIYQGVTVNDKELAINSTNELVDLLSINERAVREGFNRYFGRSIYESGAAIPNPDGTPDPSPVGTRMNGLSYMISDNPYKQDLYVYNLLRGGAGAPGTVGDAREFWRNRCGQFLSDASFSTNENYWGADKETQAKNLVNAMTSMILVLQGVSEVSMSEKVDPVIDCIFMNYRLYMLFQYARYNILHINNVAAEKIDMGFTSLEHMGIPVYLDKNCPQDKVYFIDSSQIKLLYVEGENFKRAVKEIPNKFAKQYFTSFIGNYIIEKARNCGVITIVDGTTPETIPDTANVCMPSKFVDADYKQPAETINPDDTENKGYSGSGVKVNVTSTTASNRNKK